MGAGPTETNVIAGITIDGDSLCKSTNVIYRLDTESARAFLEPYVGEAPAEQRSAALDQYHNAALDQYRAGGADARELHEPPDTSTGASGDSDGAQVADYGDSDGPGDSGEPGDGEGLGDAGDKPYDS